MAAEILERFEVIEECYEFMLAYAAQGLASDKGSESGRQIREFLNRTVYALIGLPERCVEAMGGGRPSFLAVLERDATDSLAALDLVLAQPAISSTCCAAHGRVSAGRGLEGATSSGKVGGFLVVLGRAI